MEHRSPRTAGGLSKARHGHPFRRVPVLRPEPAVLESAARGFGPRNGQPPLALGKPDHRRLHGVEGQFPRFSARSGIGARSRLSVVQPRPSVELVDIHMGRHQRQGARMQHGTTSSP